MLYMIPVFTRRKMKNNYGIITLLAILILVSPACTRTTLSSKDSLNTLVHDSIERTYVLHIPSSYDGSQAVPLVLNFHGGGGNAETQIKTSGFSELANEHGFIVAYPNGTGRQEDKLLTWNGGTCCAYAATNQVDDVGFVRALIAEVQANYKIDSKRIYATGMSNGGIFSYRLACDASDLFAAVAPVAGTQNYPQCNPTEPVSVIHFHGTEDGHVGYNGGAGPDAVVDVPFSSVKESISFWVKQNSCTQTSQAESFSDIQHETYSDCADGTSVELYTIIGGKHAWPGGNGPAWLRGDQPTQTISATEIIWEFFVAHPKQ